MLTQGTCRLAREMVRLELAIRQAERQCNFEQAYALEEQREIVRQERSRQMRTAWARRKAERVV